MISGEPLAPEIAHVFITEELARRPPKKNDYRREKRALQELAQHMSEAPDAFLPRFVDLALQMSHGASAGLSLSEPDPAPEHFRWRHVRGRLASFDGSISPRHGSPCGVTLDQNRPVLSRHPERVYDWLAAAGMILPEILMVPLRIDGASPLGTLWVVSDLEGHLDSGHARVATELASFAGMALRMTQTEQRLQQALEAQERVASEMYHRLGNLFAVTEGMIRITARSSATPQDMATALTGRLHALARAHRLVQSKVRDIHPDGAKFDLAVLISTIVQPHDDSGADSSRFILQGDPVGCGEHAANGMALILHELATNAIKYGALAILDGTVEIDWRIDGETLALQWRERGGTEIGAPPEKTAGFGSTLIHGTVKHQFDGKVAFDWDRRGLTVTFRLPLAAVSL